MHRVNVSPQVLRWARERAGLDLSDLQNKFPKLADWENDSGRPTVNQLEKFAKATRVPYGYLFLPEPPVMHLHLTDFRTVENRKVQRISPELMDTVDTMRLRQSWLREERIEIGAEPLSFVGAASLRDDPVVIGQEMRQVLGTVNGWANQVSTWTAAVGELRKTIEELGVMAVINGVVGNNTHRKLDVNEFRGFALSDLYAPLIFVNGADTKSAQMFTLIHELAHLWLGDVGEGLSGFNGLQPSGSEVERFCDQAAAEFLVPAVEMQAAWHGVANNGTPMERLARQFKVSPVVIGRRAMDLHLIKRDEFFSFYDEYTKAEYKKKKKETGGGDFYKNQNNRVGQMFASRLIWAAKEGRIGFKEAYDLTGLNGGTFQKYARKLGISLP